MALSTTFLNIYYNRASLQLMSLVVCKPYAPPYLPTQTEQHVWQGRVTQQTRRRACDLSKASTCLAHLGCSYVGVAFFQEQDQIFDQAVLSAVCHSHNIKSLMGKDRRQIRAPGGGGALPALPLRPGLGVRRVPAAPWFSRPQREGTSMMLLMWCLQSSLGTGGMPGPGA